MHIPISYNFRNIIIRWRTSLSTLLAISLVTAVFILVSSLYQGIKEFYSSTGDERNVIILRKGATAEINSLMGAERANIAKYYEGIAQDEKGEYLSSLETLTVLSLERKGNVGNANVQLRGVGPAGIILRPQIKLTQGRMFKEGLREVIVSENISGRFKNLEIGQKISAIRGEWTIVGKFDGRKSAYDSEIWTDSEGLKTALRRENYTLILARSESKEKIKLLKNKIENDRRLNLTVKSEVEYFADLVKFFKPIRFLGNMLAYIMAIGACFAAMNTMYTMIHHRTKDIGTLRVLGFKQMHILISFLLESVMISFLGGLLGILFALPMNGYATGTANFMTFSEMVFEFRITPEISLHALYFACGIGLAGGLLPSLSASRKPILKALKSV